MFYDDEEEFDSSDDRLVKSTKGEYDVEENVLRPKTLDAYVGQSKVKENLKVYMNAAKKGARFSNTSFYTARPDSVKLRLPTLSQTK